MTQPMQALHTVKSLTPIQQGALAWHEAGCQVIPAIRGKRPAFDWKALQHTNTTTQWVLDVHADADGVGIICGAISGNLEMLELEGRATSSNHLDAIIAACEARGVLDLWYQLTGAGYSEWTPSGGLHFLYRIKDHAVPGNTKVARRPAAPAELSENPQDRIKVLAETRGEGGFVVVAPSGGNVHPDGGEWTVASGQIGSIPAIWWNERCLLHEAIHAALDQMPEENPFTPRPQPMASRSDRPGDDFNSRAGWQEILEPHGWRIHHRTNNETFWTRPGKKKIDGFSASTGYAIDGDRLYVWSSSTAFETEKPYDKFSAFTLLEYGALNSDTFRQATKRLAGMGYGESLDKVDYAAVVIAGATPAPDSVSSKANVALRDSEGFPVYGDEVLRSQKWNHQGVSDMWSEVFEGNFSYSPATKWRAWDQNVWVRDEKALSARSADLMIRRMTQEADRTEDATLKKSLTGSVGKLSTSSAIDSILKIASRDPRIVRSHKDFDANPHLMTVKNGTLNLKTGELEPHDPKNMLTRLVNANYDKDAKTGRWTEFMEQVLPDQQVREYLQRACGYMLTGSLDERCMFLIHGESGTGKTQFLEAIYAVLGDFAGIAPATAFQPRSAGYKGPSEDLHKLMGKRFVIQSELDAGSRLNESLVKSITGGDTQSTRELYGELVDWQPEYTVFLATNYLPRISSSDNAIWNRVKPIKFEQVFVNSYGEAIDPKARNLGRKMAAQEPEVILNWLLEGLRMYQERGLDDPAQVREWLNGYREDVDTVRQFLNEGPTEDRIEIAEKAQVKVRDLYKAFLAFCVDNGITPLGSKSFTERMMSAGWKKEKREKGIMWQGIGLKGFIAEAQTPTRHQGFYSRQ